MILEIEGKEADAANAVCQKSNQKLVSEQAVLGTPDLRDFPRHWIEKYNLLKNDRALLKQQFQAQDALLAREQEILKQALLVHCEEEGVKNIDTPEGTFQIVISSGFEVVDWDDFYETIKENDALDLLHKKLCQGRLRDFLERNPDIEVKGVGRTTKQTASIRKKI